jgi:D-glycero-D-manno-heptose 1,7-bisphosphate phosphatase
MGTGWLKRPAVFIDLDGVVIAQPSHIKYVSRPSEVFVYSASILAIVRLFESGYVPVIVTNKAALSNGGMTSGFFLYLRELVNSRVESAGGGKLLWEFCPHQPGQCECRKPGMGMIDAAAEKYGLDISKSWFVDDRDENVSAAMSHGLRAIVAGGPTGLFIAVREILNGRIR